MASASAGRPARRVGLLAIVGSVAAAAVVGGQQPPSSPAVPAGMVALLRRADVASAAPESFRGRLEIHAPGDARGASVEIWRSGGQHTLVRFLDAQERGKYLLYDGDRVLFLSPGAKKPVKLPRSFRLRGSASLDDILGLRYSRDFTIARAGAEPGQPEHVVYELDDPRPQATYPRVTYVVDRESARPLRAEFHLRSGKLASTVEFEDWLRGRTLVPARLLLRDALRGGAVTEVRVLSLEPRPVPAGLFSLDDASERRKLDAAEAETEPGRP